MVQLVLIQEQPKVFEPLTQRVTARMQPVCARVVEHFVSVQAILVARQGVQADDGLVRLHGHARKLLQHCAGREQLIQIDAVLDLVLIAPHA